MYQLVKLSKSITNTVRLEFVLFVYEYLFAVVLYSCLNMFEVYTDILAYRGLIV